MRVFELKTTEREKTSEVICSEGAFARAHGSFVFTDENVKNLYGAQIEKQFDGAPVFAMKAGEHNKTENTLFALLGAMAEAGLKRTDTLVCMGGGVVGDIGGLASALYMRGIPCIQVPTTLMAQVDSSVGGKTAVDFMGVKNLIGAFNQPKQVLVDPCFLSTLPPRELRCGLGEMVKHAALDGALFEKLTAQDNLFDLQFLAETVPDNIAVKAEVVRRDPDEKNLRKCLNLGHTTGHAFELLDGKLSHGEYVLAGILFEAELAKRHLDCDFAYLDELSALARALLGSVPQLPEAERAAEFALLDKKNVVAGEVIVTAPRRKGEYGLLGLPFETYKRELAEIQEALC